MQNNRYYRCIRLLLILMVMALVEMGCIKEYESDCNTSILLKFKAIINVNGEEVEVGKEEVKELVLYVFNANDEFLESHLVEIESTIALSYPNHKELHLVCWGNSASDQQIMPELKVGDKLDESLIAVITNNTKVTQAIVETHPDNLFHSHKEIIIEDIKGSTVEMVLYHKVASVNITAKGLATHFTKVDEDYSYIFRSGKKHVSFNGDTKGDDVHHSQIAELKNGVHESGIFNILPSTDENNSVEVDIYKGSELISTISKDGNGQPFKAEEGRLLNIHADFSGGGGADGTISVSIAITYWGEKKIWKEIN